MRGISDIARSTEELRLPTVSIGMPVYNGERFIRQALDSLLGQTFADFELIISDNGSSDPTPAICLEYAGSDARVRFIRHPKNRGVFWNTQFVIQEARGEYFLLVGDDDVYDKEYVATLLDLLKDKKDTGLAYSNYSFIDEEGTCRKSALRTYLSSSDSRFTNLWRFLRGRYCLPMMMGLFRTELLKKALPIPYQYLSPMTGDVDNLLLIRVLTSARVNSTDRILFNYRLKNRIASFPHDWPKGFVHQQTYMLRHHRRVADYAARTILLSNLTVKHKIVLLTWNWVVFVYLYSAYVLRRLREECVPFKASGS